MKTIVVTTTFPQWEGDPRGAFIRRHWELACEKGDTVEVLAPRTAWTRGELESPLRVHRVAYAPQQWSTLTGNFGILENIRAAPRRALLVPALWGALRRSLWARLYDGGVDRVAAHMLIPAGWVAAEVCSRHRVPYDVYGHGTDVDIAIALPGPLRRRLGRALAGARTVFVPSADKAGRLRAAMPHLQIALRVEPMLHCVPEPAEVSTERRGPEILFIGRLIRQKGVDDLLHAVSRIRDPITLHIAGEGPEAERLERLAKRLCVPANFHGFVWGPHKEHLFRRAAVVCVPSRRVGALSEGAPLVVREALSYGARVVATSEGGIPELCGDTGRVWLVPAGEPAALSEALRAALRHPVSQVC